MRTTPSLALWLGILAIAFHPSITQSEEKSQIAAPARYDLEIVDGKLLLANLKTRVTPGAKTAPGEAASVLASMGNIVDVLRQLHPGVNIVMAPGIEKIRINNLKLRSTTVEDELEALRVASGNRFLWTDQKTPPQPPVDPVTGLPVPRPSLQQQQRIDPATGLPVLPASAPREEPLYMLTPSFQPTTGGRMVEVFNLGPYFQQFGEPDRKEVDQTVQQIEKIIADTALSSVESGDQPSFQYHPGAKLLIVTGTPEAIDIARKVIGAMLNVPPSAPGAPEGMPGVYGGPPGYPAGGFGGAAFQPGAMRPIGYGSVPALPPSRERKELMAKLENIRLDADMKAGWPLKDVVAFLVDEAKKRDPEKRGLNFLIDPSQPGRNEPLDINQITIRIQPPLRQVRLVDLLDAIVRVADHPIRYTVTDYAVVFSLPEPPPVDLLRINE